MLVPAWRVRDFRDDDVDQAIAVWDQSRPPDEPAPIFGVAEVMSAARVEQPAVVAVVGDSLVGMAVAQAQGERAWERCDRLLICATNSVRSLDPAFLRPGRFDYVLPIGPPDPTARAAIWCRYLGPAIGNVDIETLVAASEMFTPADVEYAARKGAHAAFEREITMGQGEPAGTGDFLDAIAETRPTLTPQMLDEFAEDIETCTRT